MNITDKLLTGLLYYLFKYSDILVEYDWHEDTEGGIIIHYRYGHFTTDEFKEKTFVSYLDIMTFIYNQIN